MNSERTGHARPAAASFILITKYNVKMSSPEMGGVCRYTLHREFTSIQSRPLGYTVFENVSLNVSVVCER